MNYSSQRRLKALEVVLGVVAFAVTLPMAGGNAAASASAPSVNDPSFRRVSNRLLCQCGCGYMVLSCNHVECPSATYIRKSIQTQLAASKGEDAVVASFVEQYGPRILPEPPQKGFFLTAWVMPFVALLLGASMVWYFLWQ